MAQFSHDGQISNQKNVVTENLSKEITSSSHSRVHINNEKLKYSFCKKILCHKYIYYITLTVSSTVETTFSYFIWSNYNYRLFGPLVGNIGIESPLKDH